MYDNADDHMNGTYFFVYVYTMIAHEDSSNCYTHEFENGSCEPEYYEFFENYDDALKHANEIVESWDENTNIITHTKMGLDSVTYKEVDIDKEYFEMGDLYDSETIWGIDSLSINNLNKRIEESQASYHRFLDYKADSYHGLE